MKRAAKVVHAHFIAPNGDTILVLSVSLFVGLILPVENNDSIRSVYCFQTRVLYLNVLIMLKERLT